MRLDNGPIWLTERRAQDHELTGRKAAGLAQLIAAGYDVPSGFYVSGSYAREILKGGAVSLTLCEALRQLPSPWAIRSSTNAEDAVSRSFAGQFTTVLGVTSFQDAIAAIDSVRDGLSSDSLVAYCAHHNMDPRDIEGGMLLQTLVSASCSGVAFSRHPVSGERVTVIEAVYGLGEPLVNGDIEPDHIVLDDSDNFRDIRIGTKKYMTTMREGALTKQRAHRQDRRRLSMPLELARTLSRLARSLEELLGGPQDIEWAFGDKLYVVQSRPITT